jgi:hypothetical protein
MRSLRRSLQHGACYSHARFRLRHTHVLLACVRQLLEIECLDFQPGIVTFATEPSSAYPSDASVG